MLRSPPVLRIFDIVPTPSATGWQPDASCKTRTPEHDELLFMRGHIKAKHPNGMRRQTGRPGLRCAALPSSRAATAVAPLSCALLLSRWRPGADRYRHALEPDCCAHVFAFALCCVFVCASVLGTCLLLEFCLTLCFLPCRVPHPQYKRACTGVVVAQKQQCDEIEIKIAKAEETLDFWESAVPVYHAIGQCLGGGGGYVGILFFNTWLSVPVGVSMQVMQ